ncbi:hypothetical protein CPB84DRAFT_1846886 [Gymnopilus junonius]|uniref:Uncharacterized protein n=1 Tax=Gymnopilus junonius TaxID=109634 RepID=A0A9P5TNQ7_GYMJU|nr:hypothetical protein CPB84DRAFT_1846886 [Gymnopilus junonius]
MSSTEFASLAPLACLITRVLADQNFTVVDIDPAIMYSSQGTRDVSVCKLDANGNVQAGQAGCYNLPTQCTSSVTISQNLDGKAGATFTFQEQRRLIVTARAPLYTSILAYDISPVYTVTLDGQATGVDDMRPSRAFTCSTLFSKTGLDPTAQHTISLTVKGPSPNRNMTEDPNGTAQMFSLINFM